MPVRRDPGLPNLVVLVVVFVIFPAIGFFIRRKWRNAAARSEEIKRLLIFASEEATRAEIEATEAYSYTSSPARSPDSAWIPPAPTQAPAPAPASSPSLKPLYKCAVCFSPTSTRCAKCKAARYCSGRCQIIHWRQGHKDECRPYVPVKPFKDTSSNQEDGKDSKATSENANQPEIRSTFEPSSSEEYSPFSTPSRSSETTSTSSGDSDDTSENFVTAGPVKIHQTSSNSSSGPSVSEPTPTSYGPMGGPLNSTKSSIDERKAALNESTSSSRVDDVSNGFSFSEPSTTSSDFWGGTLDSEKSTIHELDAADKNTAMLNVSAPNGSGSKKSNDLSKETVIKSRKPPKYNSETLKPKDVAGDSDLPKVSSSPVKDSNRSLGGMPFTNTEKSTHVVNAKNVIPPASKSTSRLASNFPKSVTVHEERRTSTVKVVDQPKPFKLTRQCSQRAESETAHKYSCKGLFSYEMFVKLYNWKQVQLRPFGLVNCGNSCYANAVLQCLTHTPPLNAYFLQGLHSKACNKRDWCFTCEFEGLVLKAKNGSSSLSPVRILSQIQTIGSSLNQGRQEDAHEFLRYAIDTLQSVCLKEAGTNTTNSLEEETTLIGLTFGGHLRSKIKCMKCGGKSERNERMMDLTVEIEGNIATLEEALDKFTCTEILDGENKYKCSRCKSYERAKKTLTLLEAPNVLTIALKRFQSGKYGKLNKSIRFPEILNMAPYVSGTSDKSPVYSLYGVVVHLDQMNDAFSGHYVCYVKNVENRWFKMDDNRVKEVDVQSVLTKGAYMLLYARCSPRAPRVIRTLLSRNHQDPKKHKTSTSYALRSPWDVTRDHLTIRHRSLEEESSSSDGSVILSESCSCSTERDSSSMESWDWDHEQNSNSISSSPLWRNLHANSSDSDTSSSSSSSSFPSPLYSRHPRLYNNSDSVKVDRLGGRPTYPLETSKPGLRRSTTSSRVRSE